MFWKEKEDNNSPSLSSSLPSRWSVMVGVEAFAMSYNDYGSRDDNDDDDNDKATGRPWQLPLQPLKSAICEQRSSQVISR